MITSRSDYYYVTGDISSVTINGGIMPLRSGTAQNILRGEDPCFLIEGCKERLGWWNQLCNYYQGGTWISNPRAPSSADFSRIVRSTESNCSGIGSVPSLLNQIFNVYTYTQNNTEIFTAGFLSDLPNIEEPSQMAINIDWETFARNKGILLESYTFDGFDTTLRKDRILQLFTAMNRAKYAYISIPHDTFYKNAAVTSRSSSSDSWPLRVRHETGGQVIGEYDWSNDASTWESTVAGAYIHYLNTKIAGSDVFYSATADVDSDDLVAWWSLQGFAQGGYSTGTHAYCMMNVYGHYNYNDNPSAYDRTWYFSPLSGGRRGIVETSYIMESNAVAHSRSTMYVYQPNLTLSDMKDIAAYFGGEVYDSTSSSDVVKGCDYTFTPYRTIFVVPFPRVTY